MSRFIVRIELHGTLNETLYENLHKEMAKVGFNRTVYDTDRVSFKLPSAEYYIESNYTCVGIYQFVELAIKLAGATNYSILVSQVTDMYWLLETA